MRMYNVRGKLVSKNVSKYLINWKGKCRSKFQEAVKAFIEPHWSYCIVYEEFPVYGTLMKVDILNSTKKIAIEVNGDQHYSYNKFFHGHSIENYSKSLERDTMTLEWLEKNGYQLAEIISSDLNKLSEEFFKIKFGIEI